MSRIGLLHGINGERSDCIDAQLIDILLAHFVSLADQGMTAMWVQGLDAAPADEALKLYSKNAWVGPVKRDSAKQKSTAGLAM